MGSNSGIVKRDCKRDVRRSSQGIMLQVGGSNGRAGFDDETLVCVDGQREENMPLQHSNGDSGVRLPGWYVPRRGIAALLLFIGLAVVYSLRVCMSIAAVPSMSSLNTTSQNSTLTMYSEFHWTNTDQGIVLGAFFNGYIFTQIVGGMLSRKYGGKLVLLVGVVLASLFTALTPLAASHSFSLLVICRACVGSVSGVCFPAVMSMLVEWAAPAEKSVMCGFVFAGAYVGNVCTFLGGGWILSALGWRAIFYILSLVGLVWCILFALFTTSSPKTGTT
jgi:ACS family sodium-dependent inorganic phosphate cotransporter